MYIILYKKRGEKYETKQEMRLITEKRVFSPLYK